MIEITIRDNEFSYDVKALALAFYPEEECEVIQNPNIGSMDGYYIRCVFHGELFFDEFLPAPYDKNQVKKVIYNYFSKRRNRLLPWGILTGIRPAKIPLRMLLAGMNRTEVEKQMRDVYQCQENKVQLSIDVAEREYELTKDMKHTDCYSVYIGIPFCPTRCHYCSFAAYPIAQYQAYTDRYLDALEKEMEFSGGLLPGRRLTSIYVGGGTPTSLSAKQLERLMKMIHKYFRVSESLEFTVEAGRPDSITKEKLLVLKQYAVSRISINPQTMKQDTLERMGRKHSPNSIRSTFYLARECGFDNINMDLIVGLPGETLTDFQYTMQEIEKLRPDSITIHTLVIKRASKLREEQSAQMEQGAGLICESDVAMQMQDYGQDFAYARGYLPYYMYRQKNKSGVTKNTNQENVAYSLPGKECLYNIFIMEELETIIALGAGGSTKVVYPDENRMERVGNVKGIEEYIDRIDEMIERKRVYILEQQK